MEDKKCLIFFHKKNAFYENMKEFFYVDWLIDWLIGGGGGGEG
jgi:hypothetical protein